MRYALNLNNYGRILSVTFEKYATEDMVLVDTLPEGDISEYIYQDGKYIHDPIPVPETEEVASADDVLNTLLGVTE